MPGLTSYEIPLSPKAQSFYVVLAGVKYRLSFIWRDAPTGLWILDIADSSGVTIVAGIPLVTGVDLLAQYRHLGIGGSLVVFTDEDPAALPTYSNLGIKSHLYFIPN